MYGWRGTIGLLVPSSDRTSEMDFHELRPDGVAVYAGRVPITETNTFEDKVESVHKMNAEIPRAARQLSDAKPDIIVFSCTTASFFLGLRTDEKIVRSIESEVSTTAITTSTALVEALQYLEVASIALLTPYHPQIGALAREFLIASIPALAVDVQKDFGMLSGMNTCMVEPHRVYREGKALGSASSCDALVIACTGLPCISIVEALEADIRKPVITANTASMWLALRRLGISLDRSRHGRLLEERISVSQRVR